MKRILGFLCVALVYTAVPALAADVTGTWKWSVERNGQTFESTLKLKQEGTKLTGTISGRNNTEIEITDGKVDGDDVSFKVTREFNGNKFVQTYRGRRAQTRSRVRSSSNSMANPSPATGKPRRAELI